MTRDHGVSPDSFTFLALFKSLSVNRLVVKDQTLLGQDVVRRQERYSRIWSGIPGRSNHLLCMSSFPGLSYFPFYLLEDYAGMIVAARTMKKLFGFAPSQALLMDLAAGTSSLEEDPAAGQEEHGHADRCWKVD